MGKMKSLPISALMLYIYPNLYPIHLALDANNPPQPLHLTFANIDRNGVYLLDTYDHLFIYIGKMVTPQFLVDVFNVTQWTSIPDEGDQSSTAIQTDLGGPRTPYSVNSPPPGMMMAAAAAASSARPAQSLPNGLFNGNSNGEGDGETEEEGEEEVSDGTNDEGSPQRAKKPQVNKKPSKVIALPVLENATSKALHQFIGRLIEDRPFKPSFHILR